MNYNNEIDNIVLETHKNMGMNKINDKLYLSNNQIDILNRYNIEYKSKSIEELKAELEFGIAQIIKDKEIDMHELDEILNDDPDYDDLEKLSLELAEFNYYYNTKK